MKHAIIENSEIVGFCADPGPSTTEVGESSARWLAYMLTQSRREKVEQIKAEGMARIRQQVPALDTMAMVDLMVTLWPMLDKTSTPAEITAAKNIYQYAKTQIQAINSADQATVDAYDPATDPGWP